VGFYRGRGDPNLIQDSHFINGLLRHPIATSMVYCALIVGGLFAIIRLPLELSPRVEFPSISITTECGTSSSETVESVVSAPIEEITNTVNGVHKVSSRSEEGRSRIDIEFEPKTDMDFVRLELNEKIAAFSATLPFGISQPRIERYIPQDLRDLQGFLSFSLSGNYSPARLKSIADELIISPITSIRGVANVQVIGGNRSEIQIIIDPSKLLLFGCDLQTIIKCLHDNDIKLSVGVVEYQFRRTVISVSNGLSSLEDIKGLIITGSGRRKIRLQDIADISESSSQPVSYYRINRKPSVTIIIDKEPNVNTLRLANSVFDKIDEIRNQFPPGLSLIKESDKSDVMRLELDRLYREIIISIICILIVLTIFFRAFKASILILSSIIFSLAGTFFAFWIFGIGLNLFTLAGLVLGFGRLVDDAIVVFDNIHRHLYEGMLGKKYSISCGVHGVALPVIASTLTTIGALLPLEFLPEEIKPYFLQFGIAVGISLVISLFVSFTLIPIVIDRTDLSRFHARTLEQLERMGVVAYQKLLKKTINKKGITIALIIWMFGIPLWLLPERINSDNIPCELYNNTIGSNWFLNVRSYLNYVIGGSTYLFFEKVSKGDLWDFDPHTYLLTVITFPQGTEIARYNNLVETIENEVCSDSINIEKTTTNIRRDRAIIRIDIPNSLIHSDYPLRLKNRVEKFAGQTGGVIISVLGFGPGFQNRGESSSSFYVQAFGYNYNKVKFIAEQFRETIERNPRIASVDIDQSFSRMNKSVEIVVDLNRDAIARYGLNIRNISQQIHSFIVGDIEQNIIDVGKNQLPILFKMKGNSTFSVRDLLNTVIINSDGKKVKLANVVTITSKNIPGVINRENQQYIRTISFDYHGPSDLGRKFVDKALQATILPNGYKMNLSMSDTFTSDQNSKSIIIIALMGLIIVFMITASLFESLIKPLIIILSVPFSFIGLFLAFYCFDAPFGKGGYAAVILLIGIVVTNSVVLVDSISNHIESSQFSINGLIDASVMRLRPILMTSMTTIGGLMPLLILGDKSSMWYGLSLGTIGGMVTSTLLTLIVVPLIYAILYDKHENTTSLKAVKFR
jgi:hydrophobic/amphiphilic exporter-1 (mainly G- bacteria), HAE1 family